MLNDDQYDRKHGITLTAKGVLLAERHVKKSLDSLHGSCLALYRASIDRLNMGKDEITYIRHEKRMLDNYRDACYDLFFVHAKLIKLVGTDLAKEVTRISKKECEQAVSRLHIINL